MPVTATRLDAPASRSIKATLLNAIKDYRALFNRPTVMSLNDPTRAIDGRGWVMANMYNATFADEHDMLHAGLRATMGQDEVAAYDALAADLFTPRDQAAFEQYLADKLAINPDGSRISGKVGTTIIGERVTGHQEKTIRKLGSGQAVKHLQAMEDALRAGTAPADVADSIADFLAERSETVLVPVKEPIYAGDPDNQSVGAASMTIAAVTAILALDALVDDVDGGTGDAIIRGVDSTRPADPDAALTGTVLWNQTMSATAFNGAVDDTDGTVSATAATIDDDTSADATGTASHFRVSSTNDGATPLDDHFDGNVGTSGEDLNLNTVSIVSGANISITSYVVGMSQGSGAT